MGSGSVVAMLEALERYLGGGGDEAYTPAQAYVAGVRHGYEIATHVEGGVTCDSPVPLGFVVPPLEPPPKHTHTLCNTSPRSGSVPSLVDPDLRSTARANVRAGGDTLELFPPKPEPARPMRRRRFPEEFRLTPELRRFAEAGGLDAGQEFAMFRDHYRGNGEPRADWPATFRNWCRHSLEMRERRRR